MLNLLGCIMQLIIPLILLVINVALVIGFGWLAASIGMLKPFLLGAIAGVVFSIVMRIVKRNDGEDDDIS